MSLQPLENPLKTPVRFVKGVGEARANLLIKLGIETVGDLLWNLPVRYEDRTRTAIDAVAWAVGMEVVASGRVIASGWVQPRYGKGFFEAHVKLTRGDGLKARWYGARYLEDQIRVGDELVLFGKLEKQKGFWVMHHPEMEHESPDEGTSIHIGRIVPIYPLTEDLSQRVMRRIVFSAVEHYAAQAPEILPEDFRRARGLMGIAPAFSKVHFPDALDEAARARYRIVFEELFVMQLVLAGRKLDNARNIVGIPMRCEGRLREGLVARLPFRLTGDQGRVLEEILADMASPHPMHRLLQGDVGSGKTVVSALAMLQAVECGYQAVLMAPTEILASQHFNALSRLLQGSPVKLALLTGDLRRGERASRLAGVASGEVNLVVGTHAVIDEEVRFQRLGLAVIDEQHKFGVEQRGRLYGKGTHPDILVMTATPIPRTLAMTAYGDLDVSTMREMPVGRPEVVTRVIDEATLPKAYDFIREQVGRGRQAYIVYPLVSTSEASELRAAEDMHRRLSESVFKACRVGLLHGKLKAEEKERIMAGFSSGEIQILVATTVIEVGVDQPNATIMLIEHAERFGLSQLHQMRGRVGRGTHKSFCILQSERAGLDAWKRLKIMEETRDGFRIAEEDLEIRGMGNLLGREQSGFPGLKAAHPLRDRQALEDARRAAFEVLESDPRLNRPEFRSVRDEANRLYSDVSIFVKVG